MADGEEESSGGGGKKIMIIVVVVLLLVGGTVGGLFAAGMFGGGDHTTEEESDEEQEPVIGPAVYIPFDPAFVVNFSNQSNAKFLQITMEVMTRSVDVPGLIELHMPAIRNNLVLLFSSQTYENMSTLEGKEALREEALIVVQEILEEEAGDPGVEAVYFTSIVMQ